MPEIMPYETILWSGKPFYVCKGCAFQRFREDLVQAHCATCASVQTLLANAPGGVALAAEPEGA